MNEISCESDGWGRARTSKTTDDEGRGIEKDSEYRSSGFYRADGEEIVS